MSIPGGPSKECGAPWVVLPASLPLSRSRVPWLEWALGLEIPPGAARGPRLSDLAIALPDEMVSLLSPPFFLPSQSATIAVTAVSGVQAAEAPTALPSVPTPSPVPACRSPHRALPAKIHEPEEKKLGGGVRRGRILRLPPQPPQ